MTCPRKTNSVHPTTNRVYCTPNSQPCFTDGGWVHNLRLRFVHNSECVYVYQCDLSVPFVSYPAPPCRSGRFSCAFSWVTPAHTSCSFACSGRIIEGKAKTKRKKSENPSQRKISKETKQNKCMSTIHFVLMCLRRDKTKKEISVISTPCTLFTMCLMRGDSRMEPLRGGTLPELDMLRPDELLCTT